jgi:hypothetical protein
VIEMLNADNTALICPFCNARNSLDAQKCRSCSYLFKDNTSSPAPPGKESEYYGTNLELVKGFKPPSRKDMRRKKG